MKVIIAGSREGFSLEGVYKAWDQSGLGMSEVVSGTARGVDRLGEEFATKEGIKITRFPANWDSFGKSAGYRRNAEMATYADALIALWDGHSRGTKHMIDLATKEGLVVFIYRK